MVDILKKILIIVSTLTMGFGFWYMVIWFLSVNSNPFEWSISTKLIYLFLSYITTETTREFLMRN